LKKALLAIIGLIGIASFQPAKATIYTHRLTYTPLDSGSATLEGLVTFDSTAGSASDFLGELDGFVAIDRTLITAIEFTYTPEIGSAATVSGNEIDRFRLDFINNGSTDFFAGGNFKSQVSIMQFGTAAGASFILSKTGVNHTFNLQADTGTGEDVDDFGFLTTTYHSPAPLPILALVPAFNAISKLKRRYNPNKKF